MRKVAEHPSRSMGFLSRYHDRELSDQERLAFERHAAGCSECAAAVAEYEAILSLYRESGTEPADPGLPARISRRIDAELRLRPAVKFLSLEIDLLWASVAAIGLVAAIALYAVLGRKPAPAIVAENEPAGVPRPAPPAAREASPSPAVPERTPSPSAPAGGPRPAFAPELPSKTPADRDAKRDVGGVEGGIEGGSPAASPAAPRSAAPREESDALASAPQAKSLAGAAGVLRVGGDVAAPVLVRRVEPVLSELARRSLGADPVIVEAVISAEGDVVSTRIVRSNPAADRAVLDALRRWKYRPAMLDGQPVSVYLTVTVHGE